MLHKVAVNAHIRLRRCPASQVTALYFIDVIVRVNCPRSVLSEFKSFDFVLKLIVLRPFVIEIHFQGVAGRSVQGVRDVD